MMTKVGLLDPMYLVLGSYNQLSIAWAFHPYKTVKFNKYFSVSFKKTAISYFSIHIKYSGF